MEIRMSEFMDIEESKVIEAEKYFYRENYSMAIRLFEELAERNNVRALYFLGYIYFSGIGTEKNPEKAIICYERAAAQGHAQSLYVLGVSYYKGEGAPRNHRQAKYYFIQAGKKGHKSAEQLSRWLNFED